MTGIYGALICTMIFNDLQIMLLLLFFQEYHGTTSKILPSDIIMVPPQDIFVQKSAIICLGGHEITWFLF